MSGALGPTPPSVPIEGVNVGWCVARESWHFHQRLWLRTRVRLRYGEYSALLKQISKGHAVKISGRRGTNRDLFVVDLRGRPLFVVSHQNLLITVLGANRFVLDEGRWRAATNAESVERKRLRSALHATQDLSDALRGAGTPSQPR